MSKCVEKLPHSCGSSDALQVFLDGDVFTAFCFACGKYEPNPYGDGVTLKDRPEKIKLTKSDEEIQVELQEIATYPVVDLPSRKLKAEILNKFGVKIAVSTEDGKTPYAAYYPYRKNGEVVRYKVKLIGQKKMWAIGSEKDVELFGWREAIASGSKRLVITEGEEDAIAFARIYELYQKTEFADYAPAFVSITNGSAGAAKDLGKWQQDIKKYFKEVALCFDQDEAGKQATEECLKIFPGALVVNLPAKDANDCLKNGLGKAALKACQFNSQKAKNSKLIFGESIHVAARQEAKFGEIDWPFPKLNEMTRGIRLGETIYIGAGVKMGKSTLLNDLAASFIAQEKKVLIAKPEEAAAKTYKLLAGATVGKVFHDPKVPMDFAAYDRAGEMLEGKVAIIDVYQNIVWELIKQDIIAASQWGAKVVFLDPITCFTNGMESGAANTFLQGMAQEASTMALDYGLTVFLWCHLKAPEGNIQKEARQKKYSEGKFLDLGNCPHELGGSISSNQFAGSRAMMRSANMMLGLLGNKDPELDDVQRNTRRLQILEDREFGVTGYVDLFYNNNTTKFVEI